MTDVSIFGDTSDCKGGIPEGEPGWKRKELTCLSQMALFFGKLDAVEIQRNRDSLNLLPG